MKFSKIFTLLASAVALGVSLVSCAGKPASDGEKAAKMALELREINLDHSYDSQEVQSACREYDEFASECREKYGDDPEAMAEFERAFNETIKAGMQQLPDSDIPAEQKPATPIQEIR